MNLYEKLTPENKLILDSSDSSLKNMVIRTLENTSYETNLPFDIVCHLNQIIFNAYVIEPLKIYYLFKQ